jgi:DNA-binding CsgD family transcriptional regulator
MQASDHQDGVAPPGLLSIVGEFCLETGRYWIVASAMPTSGNHQDLDSNHIANVNGDNGTLELAHFEIEGFSCIIIKDSKKKELVDVDLITLLSGREMQIATLVAQGCANKQIAQRLRISEWTVSTYLRRIFAKLGVDSRAAMVYKCASLIQKKQLSSISST